MEDFQDVNLSDDDLNTVLLQVVRGDRRWKEVEAFGIRLREHNGKLEWIVPPSVSVTAQEADVAAGLLKYRDESYDLSRWACIVMSIKEPFGGPDRDDESEVEWLLDALWDACFTGSVSDDAIGLARKLVTYQAR